MEVQRIAIILTGIIVGIACFFPSKVPQRTPAQIVIFNDAKLDLVKTMSASLAVVAGLAWNDSFKSLFAPGGPLQKAALYGPWAIAFIVTIAAMFASKYYTRLQAEVAERKSLF